MGFLNSITNLIQDPSPEYLFEISEGGIAYVKPGGDRRIAFERLESDVLALSPLRDNVQRPEMFANTVARLSQVTGKKRRRAVLILPDFCARIAVLDFDSFPAKPEDQMSLVRFRMKKSVPFDIDDAAISFAQQPSGKGKIDVVVAAVALEILAKYEAPFRSAGLHPGIITTSALATAELETHSGITFVVKLSGRSLTLSVFRDRVLKLVRCVELSSVTEDEIMAVIFPTLAFVEDLAGKPDRLVTCGFETLGDPGELASRWNAELGLPVNQLRSVLGTPGQHNSGLLGYLESMGAKRAEAVPA